MAFAGRGFTWLAAAAVLAVPFFSPGSPVSLVRVAMEEPAHVSISGSIQGLRPDVAAALSLTLRNDAAAAVVVRSLTARVTGASPGCAPSALSIGSWSGRLVVPAHGQSTASVPVKLHDPAGSCAGATWKLSYTSA
ncbi:MAG: hypothetical protein JJD92_15150 [Frankiaceae bacterium]|nr:hypothetical protein [Frankiaceae bacterium]